jgi:competence protein ComEC
MRMPRSLASRAPRAVDANLADPRRTAADARTLRPTAGPSTDGRTATFSRCGTYRYRLTRTLGAGPTIAFVMLNPSTADASVDDPTIRRVTAFARRLGAGELVVVNLFAFRATRPRDLARAAAPRGPRNHAALRAALRGAHRVIAAWGAPPPGLAQAHAAAATVVRALAGAEGVALEALATTRDGHPRHPLYLRADRAPRPWPSLRHPGLAALVVLLLALVGCPALEARHPIAVAPTAPTAPTAPSITWRRVTTAADIPAEPPAAGAYRVHLIDVGTGLAILLQGHDFAMLYDGGSNDPAEHPLRVVSYLAAALGTSGDDLCVPRGAAAPTTTRALDHLVLSHPHFDHASALDLVLHCYAVHDIWDAGRVNPTVFYREFVAAVAREDGATYHTAADVPSPRAVHIKDLDVTLPATVAWQTFHEGDVVTLGDGARFTILHAEAKPHPDPNQNSIVLMVELGATRLLLTGDAESGPRAAPDAALGDVEAYLVDHADLHADLLQVGHHGSKTSTRAAFLRAVHPSLALISAGPKAYHGRVLPDAEILDELAAAGVTVLRTDAHDAACELTARVGGDDGPGGCDSYVITVAPVATPAPAPRSAPRP